MVSYYNPMAMYRQQGIVGPTSGQIHNSGSPTTGWYGGYHNHGSQIPTPQQYLSCMQDSEPQNMSWHHPHHTHTVFNHHDIFDYTYIQHQHAGGQQRPDSEPQLPSPPISSSEMSSPGAPGGGSVTPPNQGNRPGPVRSPYDWMTKPSYQSQPNPEIGTLSSAPLLLDFSPQDSSGKTRTKDKYRVVYTDHQRLELEKEFHFSRYITIRRKSELAANLGLSERQVKIWFQNRRAKERKQVKKREELTNKDPLGPSSVTAALSLHQQSLLHHHQIQQAHHQAAAAQAHQQATVHQQTHQQIHQQANVSTGAHQSLGGGSTGHVTVVPVPLM